MTMKKLAMVLLAAALLACCFSVSGAEGELRPFQLIGQDAFLSSFREFDSGADYRWMPWEGTAWLLNDLYLTAGLTADNRIANVSCDGDPEEKESRQALKQTLRALYEGDQTPDIETMIDAGAEAELKTDVGSLSLAEDTFTLNYQSDLIPSMKAEEFEALLRDMGLLEGELYYARTGLLGEQDYRASVRVERAGRLKELNLSYYGTDAGLGKAFFSALCPALIAGQELEDTLGMISGEYDGLETGKRVKVSGEEFVITLRRAKRYYQLSFDARRIPWNAAEFTDGMDQMEAAAADSQGSDPEAFSGIDTEAQIPETVIFEGNGVRVTALGLVYGQTGGEADAIGLRMLVEKDEGVELDRIGIPVYSVNRWKNDFRFSDGGIIYVSGTPARTEEQVLWMNLSDLKEKMPGFAGISSIEVSANVIPPEGKGETMRGDRMTLTTGVPESPLPGVMLYSDDTLTITLTGLKESDREDRIILGAACESRGEAMELLVRRMVSKLNDATFYGLDMLLNIPENGRTLSEMIIKKDNLQQEAGITSLSQVEDLSFKLEDSNHPDQPCPEVHITREILAKILPEDVAQPDQAAETLPKTLLYEQSGITLTADGLSPDGSGLNMVMENGTGNQAYLEVHVVTVNDWLVDGYWTFKAKPGEKTRQILPLGGFIPDFDGFSEILLKISPCEMVPETGMLSSLRDQAQEARLSIGPAAAHDDQGTVLLEEDGFRVILKGTRINSAGDYIADIWMINEGNRSIRWDERHDPLIGTAKVECAVNGKEAEPYVLFNNLNCRLDPGMRTVAPLKLSSWDLEKIGLLPGDVKTVDFELAVFPDADKLDYELYELRIE